MMNAILVVGALRDAVLVGEVRTLRPPALDEATLSALAGLVGQEVIVLCITSPVELPSLARNRWGTACRVERLNGAEVTLRGLARVQVTSLAGHAPPYRGEARAAGPERVALGELLDAAHLLVDAWRGGARPEPFPDEEPIRQAVLALARASTPPERLPVLLEASGAAALRDAAEGFARGRRAVAGAEALERLTASWLAAGEQSPTLRRQLWSQAVELQRTLDIGEPEAAEAEGPALLQRRLQQAHLPPEAKAIAKRELKILREMKSDHHEYSMYSQHLDWLARLPWHVLPLPAPRLDAVSAALERSHLGLDKPKQRILEYLAVTARGGDTRSTVLCLAGPPGVGKTTIAKAIAHALGRAFAHVALGGVHDEAELRGHRLTYLAAQPGRIVTAFAAAGTATPVILLDELDKLGLDSARSPVGALLELLDPAQNRGFRDNYVATPYDVSHALFICTVNELERVPGPLRDRLEVVELDAYQASEKKRIARDRLLAQEAAASGLGAPLALPDDVLDRLIVAHTREAGVRQLARAVNALCRARVLEVVLQGADAAAVAARPVTAAELVKVLGPPRPVDDKRADRLPPGVAVGLSVGSDGGGALPVEVATWPGNGGIVCTGRMGEVMKESVSAALSALRGLRGALGLDDAALSREIHVHAPDGATPKDGPSAGVAVAVALASALTNRPVRADVTFTGELTLTGRVLPVGGIRAKALAAERAGFREVRLPTANLAEVPDGLQLQVVGVKTLAEALSGALEPAP